MNDELFKLMDLGVPMIQQHIFVHPKTHEVFIIEEPQLKKLHTILKVPTDHSEQDLITLLDAGAVIVSAVPISVGLGDAHLSYVQYIVAQGEWIQMKDLDIASPK